MPKAMRETIGAQQDWNEETARDEAVDRLNRLLSHKTDSLFGYIIEASPWVAPGDEPLYARLCEIARAQREQALDLVETIESIDGVASPLGHDIGAADVNYIDLRHMLGFLIEFQEHTLEEAEEARSVVAPFGDVAETVDDLIAADRKILNELLSLRDTAPTPE